MNNTKIDLNLNGLSKNELSYLTKPILGFVLSIVLIFIVLSYGLSRIKNLNSKLNTNSKIATSLRQKKSTLESVNNVIPQDNIFLDIVLPSKAAVLYGLSQVKNLAGQNSIILSDIKTSSEISEQSDINRLTISFQAEGEQNALYNFFDSLSKSLPLMNIAKLSVSQSGQASRADVTVSVFSADLPKKIPSVSESIKGFTSDESNLLKELSTYQTTSFSDVTTALEGSVSSEQKRDPFAN